MNTGDNRSAEVIRDVIGCVSGSKSISLVRETLKVIAKHAEGDLRAVINDLESLALGGSLSLEDAPANCSF